MTTAIINKVSTDQIEMEFVQFGKSSTQCSVKDDILDGKLDYHFSINELSVNLRNCPIHPVAGETILFQIQKRNKDKDIDGLHNDTAAYHLFIVRAEDSFTQVELQDLAAGLGESQAANDLYGRVKTAFQLRVNTISVIPLQGPRFSDSDFEFRISEGRKMFSTPEFIQAIKQWALRFSQNLTRMGLNPIYFGYTEQEQPTVAPLDDLFHPYQVIQYLEINSTNDGSIEIVGSKDFWNSFCIQLTPYGASLLGIDLDQLQNHDGRYFLASNDDSFSTPFLDRDIGSGQYRFEVGGNTTERTFQTITPIYQSCDQRVKISVTSGLNILSNVKIVNGLQTTDRTIAEAFFENRLTSEITRAGTTFETKLTSKIYAGQMSMIRKSDQYHSWTKLLNSFDTKFFRFYIWVTYRIFNDATNKWAIQTKLLDVDDNDYWLFQIRFVSDV